MSGFQHAIAGGSGDLVVPEFQSPNFDQATQTGWALLRDGEAFVYSLTAKGAVTSNTVVVRGSGDGIFVYDGTPGPGTLVLAIASASGADQYGNPYSGPGMSLSFGGQQDMIQIRPDKKAMLIYG